MRPLLLALLLLAAQARAATLIHMTLEEMAERSSAILRGRCVRVYSQWNPQHTDIYTHSVFRVERYYRGLLGMELEIVEPGGAVDGWESVYPGIPRFAVGEEAVLFLWTGRSGRHQVIGYGQGVFRLTTDGKTVQSLGDEPVIEPDSHAGHEVRRLEFKLSEMEALLVRRNKQ